MAFEGLTEKLSNAFKKLRGKGRLSEADVKDAMREIRLALLEADVSYKVVKDFIKKTTERAVGTDVLESLTPAQMIVKIVNEELTALMGSENQKIHMASQPPTVVMLVGLQGAGKTTNGAKLAGLFKKQNKNPLLVACDIYRPAAIKQLQVVGGQLGIPVFEMGQTNPVDIAKAAIASRFVDELPEDFVERRGGFKPRPERSYDEVSQVGGYGGGYSGQKQRAPRPPRKDYSSLTGAAPKQANIQFAKGDMIQHKAFGRGMVLTVLPMGNDALLEIAFDGIGTKRLMANTASQHMTKL